MNTPQIQDAPPLKLMRGVALLAALTLPLALTPFTTNPAADAKWLVVHTAAALLGALWLWDAWRSKSVMDASLVAWLYAAFLLILLVAALLSGYPAHSLNAWRRFASLGLIFAAVAHAHRTPAHAWRWMAAACVGMAAASAYGLFQKIGIDPFPWAMREGEDYLALPATYGHPNYAAHAMVMGIIMAVGLLARGGTRWIIIPLGLMAVHFYFTGVRGGTVALLGAALLAIAAGAARRRISAPNRAALAAIAVVALTGALGAAGVMGFTYARTGSPFPLDNSLILRYNSFYGAARMILERPLTGYGPGVYVIENPRFWTPYEQQWFAFQRRMNNHVHNDYLEAAVDGGLPALSLYIAFVMSAMVFALFAAYVAPDPGRRRLARMIAAALTAFAIDGVFGFNLRLATSGFLAMTLAGLLEGVFLRRHGAAPAGGLKRWAAPAAACALGLLCVFVETRVFAAHRHLQYARAARAANFPQEALSLLDKAERLEPWSWLHACEAGQIELGRESLDASIAAFERSAARNPAFVMNYIGLTRCYARIATQQLRDRTDATAAIRAAERYAQEALALCPDLPEGLESMGRVWLLRGVALETAGAPEPEKWHVWREAEAQLLLALRNTREERNRVQKMLAQAYTGMGDPERAERAFISAAESDPADLDTWNLFARFAHEYRRYEAFIESLRAGLARLDESNHETARIEMTRLLASAQAEAEPGAQNAAEILRAALLTQPSDLSLWGDLAALPAVREPLEKLRGGLAQTIEWLAAQGQNAPEDVKALVAFLDKPDSSAAIERFRERCQKRAAAIDVARLRAEYGWQAGLYASALVSSAMSPQDQAWSLQNLAGVFAALEQWDAAAYALEQALPNLPAEWRRLARLQQADILAKQGNPEEALRQTRALVEEAPDDIQGRWVLARMLGDTGHTAEARAEYERLLRDPRLPRDARADIERELRQLGN